MKFYALIFVLFVVSCKEEQLSKKNTETVRFKDGSKLYLKAKAWGLAGNHEEITLSENDAGVSNKKCDYIFYTDEIFYRLTSGKIIVYAPQSGISVPKNFKQPERVQVIGLKSYDDVKEYHDSYINKGLKKISVF